MKATPNLVGANVTLNSQSDLGRGIAFLWAQRTLLVVLVLLGAASGYAFSYLLTPIYKADALLVPSDEMLGLNVSGAVSGLGGLGGLASLVGLGASGNKESEAVETLKSRALTRAYIEANGLLPVLFASRWDSTNNKWKPSLFSRRAPTLEDGYRLFDKQIRTVVENRKTGLTVISVAWKEPKLAKQWADGLVSAANELLRTQALERSDRNLEYLRKASDSTSIVEVKQTIYKLMETEIKKQMVAYGGKDYAFRIVDPAVVPEHKVFPLRSLFLAIGAVLLPSVWLTIRGIKGWIAAGNHVAGNQNAS